MNGAHGYRVMAKSNDTKRRCRAPIGEFTLSASGAAAVLAMVTHWRARYATVNDGATSGSANFDGLGAVGPNPAICDVNGRYVYRQRDTTALNLVTAVFSGMATISMPDFATMLMAGDLRS